jgi:hypothetical protein
MPFRSTIELCHFCKHFRAKEWWDAPLTARKCNAFPDGIPAEVGYETYDHREPFPGDNGIQFEKQDDFAVYQEIPVFRNFQNMQQVDNPLKSAMDLLDYKRSLGIIQPLLKKETGDKPAS